MALLNFWRNSRTDVLNLRVEQIVANAGDGLVKDNSLTSHELRQYFSECPTERLSTYAQQCLDKGFNNSGFVLQDIVNEFGRRLDFEVESGLYRGKPGAIGFDGVWRVVGEPDIIIEVKTTDYITIDLETHRTYKERLIEANRTQRNASTLIIVGREDTGALEAQIRGSRYAWEMRLISVESLIQLVQIKEKSDDLATVRRIRGLLKPFEYTKIDKIIDIIFTTTQSVETQKELQPSSEELIDEREAGRQVRTDLELLNAKRQSAVDAFAKLKGVSLVARSVTLFSDPEKRFRVCCAVSKRYEKDYQPYWYAYHPAWDMFLAAGEEAYFIIACMDRNEAYALPYSWLKQNKASLNTTDRGEKSYWHLPVTTMPDRGLAVNLSKVAKKVPLAPYRFQISG